MTGIYSVPGAQLRSQQHKQTRPNICILIHFWKQFLSSSPLQYCSCSFSFCFPVFLANIQPKHTWSKKNKKSPPAKHRRARDGGREAAVRGQRGVVVCREECCLAYNLTSKTQSVSVNKGLMLGGGC